MGSENQAGLKNHTGYLRKISAGNARAGGGKMDADTCLFDVNANNLNMLGKF